jgi:hypothetical protein
MARHLKKNKQSKTKKTRSRSRSRSRRSHKGGSPASNRVMSFVNPSGVEAVTPQTPRLHADPRSLNLYQTTGGGCLTCQGSRADQMINGLNRFYHAGGSKRSKHTKRSKQAKRSKRSKSSKRSKKSKRMNNNKTGGGSATDFRDTLYSRAIDIRADEVPLFNAFTNEKYLSPAQLVNEPNVVPNPPYLDY